MDNAFTLATDVIFADPTMTEDGVYTPLGGTGVACPGIRSRIDATLNYGVAGTLRRGWRLLLPNAVVSVPPTDGATWVVDDVTLTIRSATRDSLQLVWTCDADDT